MRQAQVFRNGEFVGMLTENDKGGFLFRYDDQYFIDSSKKPISLTLPKTQQEYSSTYLFPFFASLLTEGANRKLQSKLLKIDENDDFGLLLAIADADVIGAITVKSIQL